MSVVDSSIEALAFNPVNLGPLLAAAINSFWAWIAVVTAAVSFWRLRSTTSSSTPTSTASPPAAVEPETTMSPSEKMMTVATSFQDSSSRPLEKRKKEEEGVLTRGNSMKELFMAVYKNDDVELEEERESNDDQEEDEEHVDGGDETVVKRWRRTLTVEMRGTGDLGWYSYQDRAVIDGSVVRLWGEERESDVSPACRSSCSSSSESPRSCRRRFTVGVTTTSLLFT